MRPAPRVQRPGLYNLPAEPRKSRLVLRAGVGYRSAMPRPLIAVVVGLPGFVAYVMAAVTLADRVAPLHWAIQALYFLVVGVLWALPGYWLIVWASRK